MKLNIFPRFEVSYLDKKKLVLHTPKMSLLLWLTAPTLVAYPFVSSLGISLGENSQPFLSQITNMLPVQRLFVIVILLSVAANSIYCLKSLLFGDAYIFDKSQKLILRNKKEIASFKEIRRLQIKTLSNNKGRPTYLLTMLLNDRRKVKIAQFRDYEEVRTVAKAVGKWLQVQVADKK